MGTSSSPARRGWRPPSAAAVAAIALLAVLVLLAAAVAVRAALQDPEHAEGVPRGPVIGAAQPAPHIAAGGQGVTKVLAIVVENHNLHQMQEQMPYLASVGDEYGYATGWTAIRHPSLPNYLAILGGSTFGISNDAGPGRHPLSGGSVLGSTITAGGTAKMYLDEMPDNCALADQDTYAVRHNPWTYFVDERSLCQRFDVPIDSARHGSFNRDVRTGSLPTVGFLVPDTCNDAHDHGCTLARADSWLHSFLPQVFDSPDFRSGRLAVVITADEDDRHLGNRVLTVVAAASLDHAVVDTPLTHYSLSAFLSEVSGTEPLRQAATAPSLAKAFGLRLG